jgi:hypothetical protein
MVSLQWYGGKDDKNLKAWINCHLYKKHIELGFPNPKDFIWISSWHLGKYQILSLNDFDKKTSRLTIDNRLNNLTQMVDDQMVLTDIALHMVSKMELVAQLHESLLENIYQARIKRHM